MRPGVVDCSWSTDIQSPGAVMVGVVCLVGEDLVLHGRLVALPSKQDVHLGGRTFVRADGSMPTLTILNILVYER